MSVKIITGNLLDNSINCIVKAHQVNYYGIMGAGIAAQIKAKWPRVYDKYAALCKANNPEDLLGNIQAVPYKVSDETRYIVNLFSQIEMQTDYNYLKEALLKLKTEMEDTPGFTTLGLPVRLGCGIAGGDWEGVVLPMIHEIFDDSNIECILVEYVG